MYKVVMNYPDGTTHEEEEIFRDGKEAEAYGLDQLNNYNTGGEVLRMSNPGDYPLNEDEDDSADFDVIEVDA